MVKPNAFQLAVLCMRACVCVCLHMCAPMRYMLEHVLVQVQCFTNRVILIRRIHFYTSNWGEVVSGSLLYSGVWEDSYVLAHLVIL